MSRFIKVTTEEGRKTSINVDYIQFFDEQPSNMTRIVIDGEDDYIFTKDSYDIISRLITETEQEEF